MASEIVSRRTALRLLVGVGGASVLAACASAIQKSVAVLARQADLT